jgi:hypothetical protein
MLVSPPPFPKKKKRKKEKRKKNINSAVRTFSTYTHKENISNLKKIHEKYYSQVN